MFEPVPVKDSQAPRLPDWQIGLAMFLSELTLLTQVARRALEAELEGKKGKR